MSRSLFHYHHEEVEWLETGPEYAESEEASVETNSRNEGSVQEDDSLPHEQRDQPQKHSSGNNQTNESSDSVAETSVFGDDISSEISDDDPD